MERVEQAGVSSTDTADARLADDPARDGRGGGPAHAIPRRLALVSAAAAGWLTFERWIPWIWSAIYACFYASALLAWNAGAGWGRMVGYTLLLVLVQSYTWLIGRTRRLASGTAAGFAGWLVGVALAVATAPVSALAALLLVPFLLWSPVGTFVTWRMQRLNR